MHEISIRIAQSDFPENIFNQDHSFHWVGNSSRQQSHSDVSGTGARAVTT